MMELHEEWHRWLKQLSTMASLPLLLFFYVRTLLWSLKVQNKHVEWPNTLGCAWRVSIYTSKENIWSELCECSLLPSGVQRDGQLNFIWYCGELLFLSDVFLPQEDAEVQTKKKVSSLCCKSNRRLSNIVCAVGSHAETAYQSIYRSPWIGM